MDEQISKQLDEASFRDYPSGWDGFGFRMRVVTCGECLAVRVWYEGQEDWDSFVRFGRN